MTRLEKVNLQLVMVKAAYNISSGLRDFSFRSEEHSHRDFRLHRPSGFYTLLKSGAELRICLHILLRSDHARLWRAQARGLAPLGRVHHIQSQCSGAAPQSAASRPSDLLFAAGRSLSAGGGVRANDASPARRFPRAASTHAGPADTGSADSA